MDKPKYQMDFPRDVYMKGDTVDGFTCRFVDEITNDPIIPFSVCAQIKGKYGKLVHTYTYIIDPDGTVSFPDVVVTWEQGDYVFDVEYILAGGKKRTYVTGTLPIKGDVSNCQI